ncbi:MAG: 50S ribosomal protein L25 [Candidatus Aminicenantes bacterium]|nr:MAG: 50S ribosomal protein L25 [Candidatus Aminicenantes bacterium]
MSFKIKGEKREVFGKNASRRLRRNGMIPVILYGAKDVNIPLTLNKKDVFQILRSESGENTVFEVSFNSETMNAMIKDLQKNLVTDEIIHADLIQIALDKAIRISVPVVTVGDAVGVKTEGGFVDFITREIEIECLPKDIPEQIEIDISELHLRQSFKVEEVVLPGEIKLISDPETILFHIEEPAKEEEIEVEEEEEEVIGEEEEPEVIKKEKLEEEEKEEKKEEAKEGEEKKEEKRKEKKKE